MNPPAPEKKTNTIRKEVSPKTFSEMLRSVELKGIYIRDLKAVFSSVELAAKGTFEFHEESAEVNCTNSEVQIDVSYKIRAKSGRKKAADLRVTYRVILMTSRDLPQEFFEFYRAHRLPTQTFPYVRELVNNLFSRTDLPLLVLPLREHLLQGDTP